jgi:CRP-like cAMP-binding protein
MKAATEPFLTNLLLHTALDECAQQAILELPGQPIRLRKKQQIVTELDLTKSVHLIVSGMAARHGQTKKGARQTVAFYLPGEVIDLHSVASPVRLGAADAICETLILQVPRAALCELINQHTSLASAFWRETLLTSSRMMQWFVNVGRREAQERIAHLFCEMAVRMGAISNGKLTYGLPLSQEQLGDATGLTSVHVNRSLRALNDVVTLKAGRVTIHDWVKLARVGEFDPAYLVADTDKRAQRRVVVSE